MKVSGFGVLLSFSACAAAALAGCGDRRVGACLPVQGKVTLGGRPLVGGTVSFIPLDGDVSRPRSEGNVDAQGNYSLKTAGKQGAPAGKYRVILTTSGEDKNQDTLFNPVYSHTEKSPLEKQVAQDAAPGAYDLDLVPRAGR
jgi:hypothetical protein